MHEERNRKVVREFTRIFKNEHNVDGVDHLFDENFTHHFRAPVPLPPGLEGFKQVGRMMNRAFPDVVVKEEDLIAGGDKVVERSSAVAPGPCGNHVVLASWSSVAGDGRIK